MSRRIIITIEDETTDIQAIEAIRTVIVSGGEPYQGIYTFEGNDSLVAANLFKTKATTFHVSQDKN